LTLQTYSGIIIVDLEERTRILDIDDRTTNLITETVDANSYIPYLKDSSTIGYMIIARVFRDNIFTDESYSYSGEVEIVYHPLKLIIIAKDLDSYSQEIYISFENPLPISLTHVRVQISGAYIHDRLIEKLDVGPNDSAQYYETFNTTKLWRNVDSVYVNIVTHETEPFRGIISK